MDNAQDSNALGGVLFQQTIATQEAMPSGSGLDNQVWYIKNSKLSGLGWYYTEDPRTVQPHYVRDESRKLWKALEETKLDDYPFVVLNVKGDPGAGKATTCFGWAAHQKTVHNAKICFITQCYTDYRYTTLDDTDIHLGNVDGMCTFPLGDIVRDVDADIYVLHNCADQSPHVDYLNWALRTIHIAVLKSNQKKVTVIFSSSAHWKDPCVKWYSRVCSYRTHFMRGWSADELIACWRVSNMLSVPILPQDLLEDKEKFASRLRVASGNMHNMREKSGRTEISSDSIIRFPLENGLWYKDYTYDGESDAFNFLFVHVAKKEVRLMSEHIEEGLCARICASKELTRRLLRLWNYPITSTPKWILEIYLRFLFQYAKDSHAQLVFSKMSQSWTMFRKPLKIFVARVVKFDPVLMDLTEWYVSPNETVAFLPGNASQRLFDAVYVQRDRADTYEVYFFRVAHKFPNRFLFAHGAVFLATLFPEHLCNQTKESSTAVWVRMKTAADTRQKQVDLQDERNYNRSYERYHYSSRSLNTALEPCLDNCCKCEGFYDCLFPELPPAHLVNRPKKIKLHFYIIAEKNSQIDVRSCEMFDLEYLSQFDRYFTEDRVRVASMKCVNER